MESGKNRQFPSSEKRPVGIQSSMQSMGALHKDSEQGLKRTGQVNCKRHTLDKGLRPRPRPQTLTPNHFFLFRYSQSFPPGIFTRGTGGGRFNTYRIGVKEYLPALKERKKSFRPHQNFPIGVIVLLTDEKSPRGLWPLSRITGVKTNHQDRLVQSVTLKTKSSTLKPPADKI
ncbi:hypothetical protein P5673_010734, partial [Acropora cervicornis]